MPVEICSSKFLSLALEGCSKDFHPLNFIACGNPYTFMGLSQEAKVNKAHRSLCSIALNSTRDALVMPWDQFNLIFTLLSFQFLPQVLCRMRMEGILVILIALNWPRRKWYSDILRLLALLNHQALLSQGPVHHSAFRLLAIMAWLSYGPKSQGPIRLGHLYSIEGQEINFLQSQLHHTWKAYFAQFKSRKFHPGKYILPFLQFDLDQNLALHTKFWPWPFCFQRSLTFHCLVKAFVHDVAKFWWAPKHQPLLRAKVTQRKYVKKKINLEMC